MKLLFKLSLPLMAAFLAQKGMQFIDTLMMGWIGTEALAAGALAIPTFFTILIFCTGTLSSVGIFISRAHGENQTAQIQSYLQHGIYLVVFLSLPCMCVIWFMPHLLLLLGENPQIVVKVSLLLHALVWGLPGYLLCMLFREFLSAFALTRVVMGIVLCSAPLTFIGNYVLIYGKYGFPAWGIVGIGYNGMFVMWWMFLCLLMFSRYHPRLKPHVFFRFSLFNWNTIYDMLHLGLPSGLLLLLETAMFLAAAVMMGHFGVAALAAHQIAMQCEGIAYMIPLAIGLITALQVGYAAGAKDSIKVKQMIMSGLSLAAILSGLVAILFIIMPNLLISLFLRKTAVHFGSIHNFATSFLILAGIFQCFDAIQCVANGALRGLKDTWIPMLLSVATYWIIGVGSAYYFSFYTRLKAMGVWYGLMLGLFSIAALLVWRLGKKAKALAL